MTYQEKKIDGFNLIVTTDGRILNSFTRKERKPKLTRCGYHEIGMYSPSGNQWKSVHRLVALYFIENPDNKPFVNHMDGNKTNNCISNLEWVTHSENMEHAKIHGLVHRGERNFNSKLSTDQVEMICRLMELGYRNKEIAETAGTRPHNVSLIRSKVCWAHISCKYNVPKRSRAFSEETIMWIKGKLDDGLTSAQIIFQSTNKRVSKSLIDDIRRGAYSEITGIPARRK